MTAWWRTKRIYVFKCPKMVTPKIHVEFKPQCDFQGGVFRTSRMIKWGQKSGEQMQWGYDFIRGEKETLFLVSSMWRHNEGVGNCVPGTQASPEADHARPPDLGLSSLQKCEKINFCIFSVDLFKTESLLSHLVYSILLWWPKLNMTRFYNWKGILQ